MNTKLLDLALESLSVPMQDGDRITAQQLRPASIQKVRDRTFAYAERHRGAWFRPEYDLDEIQIAQDTDSFTFRAVKKKVDRLFLSGFEFVSMNEDALLYLKNRISAIEVATNRPFKLQLKSTAHDLFRYSNCMWIKSRDIKRSLGKKRTDIRNVELDPVAGYFIAPFERLHFKASLNGEIKKLMLLMPDGTRKEYFPADIIHFYDNRKPGFTMGTPELYPALDDIALLRRIEENVEELIETNLFPVFHYKVGNDNMPERFAPDGKKETDIVKETIEYMPAGGVYISDHRHEIKAIGSESKALRIDFYLTYFKKRVFTAIGSSAVDLGEGESANRSTASALTQGTTMDIEAMAELIKCFVDFFVINELLWEGGFNPLDPEERVEIKFGIINREERLKVENNVIQKFANKVITLTEARKELGMRPFQEGDLDDTNYKLFEEPLALLKSMGPGTAAGETLAGLTTSNVTPAAVSKEKQFAKQQASAKAAGQGQSGARGNGSSTGSQRLSASKARPSNQQGTRAGPKLNRDINLTDGERHIIINLDFDIHDDILDIWWSTVLERHKSLADHGISLETVVENLLPRLRKLHEES
jgi:hypothetical protein